MNEGALKHRLGVIFFCFCCLLAVLVVVLTTNGLGPIDDHQFVRTIFQGKKFNAYILPEIGRFIPLTSQEYCFIAKFISPTPLLFHIISAIKVIFSGLMLYHCLIMTRISNLAVAILWSIVMLSVGFANAANRLQVGEINALVLILFFVWSVLATDKSGLRNSAKQYILFGGLLALATALFYKELIFIFALVFSIFEIVRGCRQGRRIPHYLWILLGIAACYLIFYVVWRITYVTVSYTNFHTKAVLQIVQDYAENDPFIVIVALPLALLRLVACFRTAAKQTIFDSLLFASMAYFGAYLLLGMFNTYYLLPTYGFAVCGVAGLMSHLRGYFRQIILYTSCIFAVNNAPIAFSDMQMLKLTANNHYRFVQYLSKWVLRNPMPNMERRNIVLAGVSSGSGAEILVSLKTFLASLGAPESAFDVKAAEPSDNNTISDYYFLRADSGYHPKIDELVIFNPYQKTTLLPPLQAPSFKEIYHSDNAWVLPRWSACHWLLLGLTYRFEFEAMVADNMRNAGYAAMLMTRSSELEISVHPLEAPAYRLESLKIPSHIQAGTRKKFDVMVQNTGNEVWPADGTLRPGNFVHLAYRWFDQDNQMVLEGDRSPFPEPIRPNDMVKISLTVKMPSHPGKYRLSIAPVQEGVVWFTASNDIEMDIY